jgi:hypothetical protein
VARLVEVGRGDRRAVRWQVPLDKGAGDQMAIDPGQHD